MVNIDTEAIDFKHKSVAWVFNRLSKSYNKGEIKTLLVAAELDDGTYRTIHSGSSNFLAKIGLANELLADISMSRDEGNILQEDD